MDYLLNNTFVLGFIGAFVVVLNLIINGLPSKRWVGNYVKRTSVWVLNLIINGLPSKLDGLIQKPMIKIIVLNLIINGLPSKHYVN